MRAILIFLLTSQQNIFSFTLFRRHQIDKSCSAPLLRFSTPSNDDFWEKQKKLAADLNESVGKSLKEEQMAKYTKRAGLLLGDTFYFSILILSILWCCANTISTPISYTFGATCGLAYSFGLSKYVETLGGDSEAEATVEGAGFGQARFAFLILLLVLIGKFQSSGAQAIPAIAGFFTYQLASLSQALRQFEE
mmetsp:Transcript_27285/g.31142  ORF Transcript_27285/g.31142 Transcript_27285/m.31142 type:complete len:193 (-) Transcript_27285:81-659(-)